VKRRGLTIAVGVSAAVIFAATTGIVLASRSGPAPIVKGYLRPEDPAQIERAIRRERWEIARGCAAKHEFKLFFGLCVPDLALGHIREVGSLPDRSADGAGRSITNWSMRAYALSGRRSSAKAVKYGLRRDTNGWEVITFGYQ
jgi:hypothetical protein